MTHPSARPEQSQSTFLFSFKGARFAAKRADLTNEKHGTNEVAFRGSV